MANTFSLVQAEDALYCVSDDGTQIEGPLVLPAGCVLDPDQRIQVSILAQKVIITRAVTPSIWMDPLTFVLRPLSIDAPLAAPVIASGGAGSLTGTYYAAYSYVIHINGVVVQESPRSPLSTALTVSANDINWSALVPSDSPYVTGYRLYRTVADGSGGVLFQVTTLTDPSATTYTGDDVVDASLSLLPAPNTGNPPATLGVCVAWRNRLWAVGTEPDEIDALRYTEVDAPFDWFEDNSLPVPVKGEDQWGVIGFLPRRDELVIAKRSRFVKVIGNSASDFEIIIVAEGPGAVSTDSCCVIHDRGYCHGLTGVWEIGPEGVQDITIDRISAWFQTDVEFSQEPEHLRDSLGGFNPLTNAYELQLYPTDATDPIQWLSFDLARREWCGPYQTAAFTITARGTVRDPQGQSQPLLGGSDGYLYRMNQAAAGDYAGAAPAVGVGIAIDWRTKQYTAATPNLFHVWGQITVHQRAQGDAAGSAEIMVFTGPIDERGLFLPPATVKPNYILPLPLTRGLIRTARAGAGQMVCLWFRHNFIASPLTGEQTGTGDSLSDVELWGIEIPTVATGARGYGSP